MCTAALADVVALVPQPDGGLTREGHAPQPKLDGKRRLVGMFAKTWSDLSVHLECGIEDLPYESIELCRRLFLLLAAWRRGALASLHAPHRTPRPVSCLS